MKYIAIPIYRLVIVFLFFTIVLPMLFCVGLLAALWSFNFSFIQNVYISATQYFHIPQSSEFKLEINKNKVYITEEDPPYYFKNPIDYLFNKKTEYTIETRDNSK